MKQSNFKNGRRHLNANAKQSNTKKNVILNTFKTGKIKKKYEE